jgi:hypothetical protein
MTEKQVPDLAKREHATNLTVPLSQQVVASMAVGALDNALPTVTVGKSALNVSEHVGIPVFSILLCGQSNIHAYWGPDGFAGTDVLNARAESEVRIPRIFSASAQTPARLRARITSINITSVKNQPTI